MDRPYQFRWVNRAKESQIVLPVVSSKRRKYIPMSFIDKKSIIINSAQVIFDPNPYIFALLNSKIHMAWVKLVYGTYYLNAFIIMMLLIIYLLGKIKFFQNFCIIILILHPKKYLFMPNYIGKNIECWQFITFLKIFFGKEEKIILNG